jgi:hypothetical protein
VLHLDHLGIEDLAGGTNPAVSELDGDIVR